MKVPRNIFLICLLQAFLFFACNSNKDDDNNGGDIGLFLKHDGTSWATSQVTAEKESDHITILGNDDIGRECEIVLWYVWGPDIFTLGGNPITNIGNARWTDGAGGGHTYKTNDGRVFHKLYQRLVKTTNTELIRLNFC